LSEALEQVRRAGHEAGLTVPILVPEADREDVATIVRDHLGRFDVLHTGDLGLARAFGDRVAVTFQGAVTNRDAMSVLAGIGVRHVRLTLPYPRLVRDLSDAGATEVQVFGSIPANFTPLCLWRTTHADGRSCDPRCVEERIAFRRGPDELVLRAKGLMTGRLLDMTPRLADFAAAGTLLVDAFGLSREEVSEAVDAATQGRPARTDRPRFDGPREFRDGDVFRSEPWRRRTLSRDRG